jgi:hypothetical protein
MTRRQLKSAKRQFSRLILRRRSRSDGGAFKRFLERAPDFDVLDIKRSKGVHEPFLSRWAD